MYRKILIPLDGSERAERALPHALAIARGLGCELELLRVCRAQSFLFSKMGVVPRYPDDALAGERRAAWRYLRTLRIRRDLTETSVSATVLSGPVAETLVDHAREGGADLIVMSARDRSGVGRWVRASVAERVRREAPCPVLLVRAA